MEFAVTFASSARKHRISRARIQQALTNHTFTATVPVEGIDPKVLYLGVDERGVELEIIAVVLPRMLLVIHAMPTNYRRSNT